MKRIKNERGSASFYAIWMLGLTAILLILIVNIVKVYATKEQASISAEQAVLAATDVVYDVVNEEIDDYEGPIPDGDEDNDEGENEPPDLDVENELREEINDKKREIQNNSGISESQAKVAAVNSVLSDKLKEDEYRNLKESIQLALQNATSNIKSIGGNIAVENKGNLSDTIIYFFNDENRIEIETAVDFEEEQFQNFFVGASDSVSQKAIGPKIEFVTELDWNNITIQ